jgi:hypothetical protein
MRLVTLYWPGVRLTPLPVSLHPPTTQVPSTSPHTAVPADTPLCNQPLPPHADELVGVALLCDRWSWSDGWLGRPGWPRLAPQDLPTEADLAAAGEAVRQQADGVKQLKQQQGLTNKVGGRGHS